MPGTPARHRVGVCVIGTGEAFTGSRVNCSALLEGELRLLCDCGPTVPAALWRERSGAPDFLDGLYLSHFHGDHVFGVPFLLARMHADQRRRPLALIGQPGTRERVERLVRCAYSDVWEHLGFAVEEVRLAPGRERQWRGYRLRTAWSDHSRRNGSLRVDAPAWSFAYSGDGNATPETRTLFHGVDVLVHESYAARRALPAHSSAEQVVALARAGGVRTVALVHVARDEREAVNAFVASLAASGTPRVLVPDDGDFFALPST